MKQDVWFAVDGFVLLHHCLSRRVRQGHQICSSGGILGETSMCYPRHSEIWGVLHQLYLFGVQWEDEPLTDWWGKALVGMDEGAGVLSDVPDVEHVVEAAVAVGDQVAHQVAAVLVRVDVVENYHRISIETGGDSLS